MPTAIRYHWLFILLLIVLSAFYIWGVVKVPFHPDESTYIFMSADFENIVTNPLSMVWEAENPLTDIFRYRLIDAPLTRYLLGIGRALAGLPAPVVDWDWSASWEANRSSEALPVARTLLIERLTLASLFPICLLLLYLIGLKLDGRLMGIFAILLLSLHPLILLHTRRAMAEGVLMFGIILTLYAFTKVGKHAFLVGLAVAVAFNAKHSAILLLPIGIIAVCWLPNSSTRKFSKILINLTGYLLGFVLLTALLNPVIWRNPFATAREALIQRQILLNRQLADIKRISPAQVLETPAERAAVSLAQMFIAPPIFSEVGNYRLQTAQAEVEYLSTPGNNFWRNSLSAGITLGLTLLGIIAAFHISSTGDFNQRRILILFLLSFLLMVMGIILMIPLAWQRYSVPLIPFVSIFASLGLVWGIKNSRRIFSHGRFSSRLSQILSQFAPDSWMP
jgi:4-amino-4-deoxy-L-arabinose transferase-like glycosyltransferase